MAWLILGGAIGATVEGRAPWTGGFGAAARWLGLDLAVVASVRSLAPGVAPSSVGQAIAAVIAVELALYATHRAMHASPWLWRFHRHHHAPEPLRWHRAWRVHPVDAGLFALAVTVASAAVGASPFTAAAVIIARRVWTIVLHADVRWPPSAFDRWLATPAFHHRHHREGAPPGNYAPTLAWLDVVFGTWHPASSTKQAAKAP